MPIRMVNYLSNIWLHEIKSNRSQKVSFILPIVLYNGEQPYLYPTSFKDLIAGPEELANQQFDHIFQLIDLNTIEDKQLRSEQWLDISLFFMKNIRARNILKLLNEMKELMIIVDKNNGTDFILSLYHYIIVKGDVDEEAMQQFFMKHFTDQTKEAIMTTAEQMIQKGVRKGMEQGMNLGKELGKKQERQERNLQLVKTMRNLRYESEIIAKITDLSLDEVEELIKLVK